MIATYNNVDGVWQVSQDTISYTYNESTYEISISAIDGGIQMNIADLQEMDDDTLNGLINDIKDKITSDTSTIGQITNVISKTLEYKYTLESVGNFNSIGVYNNTAVLAYDDTKSTWIIDKSTIESIFTDTGLSVQLADNELTFSVTVNSTTIDTIKTNIENFMSSIDMYYEDFSETTTYTKAIGDIVVESKTITAQKEGDDDFEVNYIAQASLSGITSTDNRLNVRGDSTITVSLNESNISGGYTLGDVTVRVGKVSAEISDVLKWKLTELSIDNVTGSGYVSINDGTTIVSTGTSSTFGDSSPDIIAGDRIDVMIYSNTKLSNSDTGDYAVTLQVQELANSITNGALYVELSSILDDNLKIVGHSINGIVANFGGTVNDGYITGGNYVLFVPEETPNGETAIMVSLLETISQESNLSEQGIQLGTIFINTSEDGQITYMYSSNYDENGEEFQAQYIFNEFSISDSSLEYGDQYIGTQTDNGYSITIDSQTHALEQKNYLSITREDDGTLTYQILAEKNNESDTPIYSLTIDGEIHYYQLSIITSNLTEWTSDEITFNYLKQEDSEGQQNEKISITLNQKLRDELFYISDSAIENYSNNTNISKLPIKFSDNNLLIDENYNILSHFGKILSTDLNEDGENIEIEYNTHAVRNKYELRDVDYPNHTNKIYNLGYASKDKEKFEISIKQGENEVAKNELLYQINGSDLTIKMPNVNNVDLDVKVSIKTDNQTITNAKDLEGKEPKSAQPIILTQDIRLSELTAMLLSSDVSRIGNDYYIAYHGSSLFTSTDGTSNFIKDLSLLVENNHLSQNTGSLFSEYKANSNITIKNLSIYGSLINFGYYLSSNSTDNTTSETTPTEVTAVIATNAILDNIKTYLNVDAKYGLDGSEYQNITLSLFASKVGHKDGDNNISTGYNYGFISVPNGIDGKDGETATSYSDSPTAGGDGTAGKGIKAYKDSITGYTVNNLGVLRAGDGGNAGAGGSTHCVLGIDGIRGNATNTNSGSTEGAVFHETTPGTAGDIGAGGTITGFNGNAIAVGGASSTNGVRGREPFGNLVLRRTESYWASKTVGTSSLKISFAGDEQGFISLYVATDSMTQGTWEIDEIEGVKHAYYGVAWINTSTRDNYLPNVIQFLFGSGSAFGDIKTGSSTCTWSGVPQPNGEGPNLISQDYGYYQFAFDEKGNVKVADNDKYN